MKRKHGRRRSEGIEFLNGQIPSGSDESKLIERLDVELAKLVDEAPTSEAILRWCDDCDKDVVARPVASAWDERPPVWLRCDLEAIQRSQSGEVSVRVKEGASKGITSDADARGEPEAREASEFSQSADAHSPPCGSGCVAISHESIIRAADDVWAESMGDGAVSKTFVTTISAEDPPLPTDVVSTCCGMDALTSMCYVGTGRMVSGDTIDNILLEAIGRLRVQLRDEAECEALRSLRDHVGVLAETFRASYAWLFLYDPSVASLSSVVLYNVLQGRTIGIGSRSIVSHVAATRRGYLAMDVRRDPYYLEEVNDARSALSVPITSAQGDLLGVLHFESSSKAAFSCAHLEDVATAALSLVPHLHLLQLSRVWQDQHIWCPYGYGWSIDRVLSRWVYTMMDAVSSGETPAPGFTLWHVDWEKQQLWVRATSRYDYEYMKEDTLPLDSFTGRIAQLPPNAVRRTRLDDAEGFLRYDKARSMGLTDIVAAPVYCAAADTRANGVLSMYSFSPRSSMQTLSNSCVAKVSATIGRVIRDYQSIKSVMAAGHVHQRIARSSNPCATYLEAVLTCLEADEGTLLEHDVPNRALVPVATTGLSGCREKFRSTTCAVSTPIAYHLDNVADRGLTVYVAEHPGMSLRINDIPNPSELGLPPDLPRPCNKYRERGSSSQTEHRRIVAVSIEEAGSTLGVLRAVRGSESRPYNGSDEAILMTLAPLCVPLLKALQCASRLGADLRDGSVDKRETARPQSSQVSVVSSLARLIDPIPAGTRAPKQRALEVLQSLVSIVVSDIDMSDESEVRALLYNVSPQREARRLCLYAYHSSLARCVPDEDREVTQLNDSNILIQASSSRRIMTSETVEANKKCAKPTSRAVVPVISWTGDGLFEGLLVLDIQSSIKWTADYVWLLNLVASRLSITMGVGVPLPRYATTFRSAVERYLLSTRELLFWNWAQIIPEESESRMAPWVIGNSSTSEAWPWLNGHAALQGTWGEQSHQHYRDEQIVDGVWLKVSEDGQVAQLPLQIGGMRGAQLRWSPLVPAFRENPVHFIGQTLKGWLATNAQFPDAWSPTFSPVARQGGTQWEVQPRVDNEEPPDRRWTKTAEQSSRSQA